MQNLHLLEFSAEAFRGHVHHYQCLVDEDGQNINILLTVVSAEAF